MAEQKASAGRYKGLLALFLVFGPAFFLVFISTRGCEHKFKQLDDLGAMPAFEFTDINGKKYNNHSFNNQILLISTIQTTCPDSCGVSLWHLDQMIYQHLRKNQKKLGHVRLVSFVTDGKGNPSDALQDVAYILEDQVEAYDPKIWMLAKGDARKIYNINRNGENLLRKGKSYFGGEAFQELLLLVDKSTHLRMVLRGDSEGMVRRMKEHIALLDKEYDKLAAKKAHDNK